MRKLLSLSSVASLACVLITPTVYAQAPGVTCQTVTVPMRDGTLLTTDIYMPAQPGRYPVLVQRNPYARLLGGGCFTGLLEAGLSVWPQNGYVVVSQDVRGSFTSQGTFHLMTQEAQDGYDTIEWAAAQPWSNGKVGTMSGSYLGLTQWQPAIHTPPHLAAIAPGVTGSDYHDNWTYVNGVFDLWLNQSWPGTAFVPDQIVRAGEAEGLSQSEIDQQVAAWDNAYKQNILTNWVWQLPLESFSQFRQFAPYYYDWLDHPSYDGYWAAMDVESHYPNVKVPALIGGAWYDLFNVGEVRNFHGMRTQGGTAEARDGTKIVMQAYGHSGDSKTPTFGNDASDPTLQLRFFDHYLKGIDNGVDREPPVHLYVLVPPNSGNTGSGFWITGEDFPLPGTETVTFYLRSHGHANSSAGDGVLVATEGDDENSGGAGATPDHFVYDPMNPVPTAGGNMCCDATLPPGAREQSAVESRVDVLVYTSAPLEHDMAVIGTVNTTFWANTSARDTDFTVKLVDVHPDGLTHNVLDRIVRARYRLGSKLPPSRIQPHKPYQYTLELGNTATVFRAGHQVRVEISSSNFPHFARNLNTGRDFDDEANPQKAMQTILHDPGHPSYIALPVAPDVAVP